ncbi:O-antigen polysaccharide polymerase Wzy [Aeromonas allosaccharophila]|uniref:O-antigen polysaccharide polymerase Wzy n=1 Tax=Aeromonas allosaccharophila TaxID=656 RepID=UPI00111AA41F|nr:O-antigen polysaccharide polymerase Wzy [Aeromonas allosaccharophila]
MISNRIIVLFTSIFMFCAILVYYLHLEISGTANLSVATIISLLPLLFTLILAKNKSILSPIGFFTISTLVFILSRPIINIFTEIDIVEAGLVKGEYEIAKTVCLVGIGVATSCLFISFPVTYEKYDLFIFKPILTLPSWVRSCMLHLSVILILLFLYKSYVVAQRVGTESYFSILESSGVHEHLKFFFLSKMILTFYLLSSSERSSHLYFWCSFLLFIGSLGFMAIGLRGYTIAYFMMFLFFLNERKKINMVFMIPIGIMIVYVSALVLEHRLGFSVFKNSFEMIYLPLGQQGASFEVVYGAANFLDEIKSCISYSEYFSGSDFGSCVDLARGVGFTSGGFASSYFAEGLYFGLSGYILLCAVIGFLIKYLDHVSALRMQTSVVTVIDRSRCGLLLFCVLPNLVYFARSSSFDLIYKFIVSCIFIAVYAFFFERPRV